MQDIGDLRTIIDRATVFLVTHRQIFLIVGGIFIILPIMSVLLRKGRRRIRRYARRQVKRKMARYITPGLATTLMPYITSVVKSGTLPQGNIERIALVVLLCIAAVFFLF